MAYCRNIFILILLCCVLQLCQSQFLPLLFGGGGGGGGGEGGDLRDSLSGLVNGIQDGIGRLFPQTGIPNYSQQQQYDEQYLAQPLSVQPSYVENRFEPESYPSQQSNYITNQQPKLIYMQQRTVFGNSQQPRFVTAQPLSAQPSYVENRFQAESYPSQQSNYITTQQPKLIYTKQRTVFGNSQQPSFVTAQQPNFIKTRQQPSQLFISEPRKATTFTKPESNMLRNNDFEQIFNSKPKNSSNKNDYDSCGESKKTVSLIVHGKGAIKGDWPWIVAVYKKNKVSTGNIYNTFKCGSTLLSEKIVVTVAHCVTRPNLLPELAESLLLKVGAFNLDDETDETVVTRGVYLIKVHENYNAELKNDIALMVMSQIVQFSYYIKPICLWPFDDNQKSIDGQQGTVVGWGKDETGSFSAEPRTVKVSILSMEGCRSSGKKYFPVTNENTFCAGTGDGSGPCNGDSGGGLFLMYNNKWYLRGLVSLSLTQTITCNLDNYIIYTDVAKYDSWIRAILK